MQASPGTWTPEHGWALRGRTTAEARPRISPSEADASATKKLAEAPQSRQFWSFPPPLSFPISLSLQFSLFPILLPLSLLPHPSFSIFLSFSLFPLPTSLLFPPAFTHPPFVSSSLFPFPLLPLGPPIPSVTQLWPDYLLYESNNSICEKTKLPRHCS